MRLIKKIILTFAIFVILASMIVLGFEAYLKKDTANLIYDEIENVPEARTVIVLGASVHSDGKLSPVLQDRIETAIELYQAGKVEQILVSGDHKTADYDEVGAMKNYLLQRGIPENNVLEDHAGFDTYDSMYRSNEVIGIKDAIVVTQRFHLPRTMFIAKNLGLDYTGFVADKKEYETSTRLRRREKLANFKALWEVITDGEPATLKKRLE
ncbi:ElyC/SanA/YdcF family protein [Zunongwangia sp. F363]|uniref:ElyC/SanA/YdcF family protein n=1 Tax=Autumnicola tepida TaxID=3075595 RepID=A0ABU3CCW4_9FLAO|nr:ElyC/SanA/YdcF family protein [Zunongwangia sp. F363]MDT0644175.1 ElyC/SanA/YdcF family protein [Zunongwangia sp. F363]